MFLKWEKQTIINGGLKNDRSDYPFGRTPWVLVIRAEPFQTYPNIDVFYYISQN
jgi:hypothetical protein